VALPLRDGSCDVTMAMQLLDHVPGLRGAVRELRRVTRSGGQALVVLNGHDHLQELRDAITAVLPEPADGRPRAISGRLRLDDGAELLAGEFATVSRHDFTSELLIPRPPADRALHPQHDHYPGVPEPEQFAAAVLRELHRDRDGTIRVRAHTGCLVAH